MRERSKVSYVPVLAAVLLLPLGMPTGGAFAGSGPTPLRLVRSLDADQPHHPSLKRLRRLYLLEAARPGDLQGLAGRARNPADGHLFALSPNGGAIREFSATGRLLATRDLSGLELRAPVRLLLAPTSDLTDDASLMSLYVADGGTKSAALDVRFTEVSLSAAPSPGFPQTSAAASLVQTIDTSLFSPPSPDPAGLGYLAASDTLLIADSEVNEMPIFTGDNLFEINLFGTLFDTLTTIGFSNEPTGVAYNPANEHLFFSDDNAAKVTELDPGPDGLYDTPDDVVTSTSTAAYGASDPEGIAFDSWQGVLFVVDGVNAEVYRVAPGANGVFDGVAPAGDDQVTNFDTASLGVLDPEGITFDSGTGHLYLVGEPVDAIAEITADGSLVRTIDISAANPVLTAGLAYAPSSGDPAVMGLYAADRGVDNNADPNENDGKVYELSLPPVTSSNQPPTVDAGPDRAVSLAVGAVLDGSVADDGLPDPPATVTTTWNLVSGPGSVTFADAGAVDTMATFSVVGTHLLSLIASDGELQASDQVVIDVTSPGGAVVRELQIAATADDAEERSDGLLQLASGDLDLGSPRTVGLRFAPVNVPPGAAILDAWVQFQADKVNSQSTSLVVEAEAIDSAQAFAGASGNITSRARTAAAIPWSPPPWTTAGEIALDQRTPDIAAVIQEIVDRPGWSSGNALALILSGSGRRAAVSFEGSRPEPALLHIEFVGASDNDPPVADDQSVTTPEDSPLAITLTASDGDGDSLGYSIVAAPANGSLSGTPPDVTYAPDPDYHGPDSFTFKANDGAADSNTATVSITVSPVNDPPVANDQSVTTEEDVPLAITLTGSDVDGDALTYGIVTGPANGSLSGAPPTVTYTPSPGFDGADGFTFKANDGAVDSAAATVSITVTDAGDPTIQVIELRVASGADDAEQRPNGKVTSRSSDLELVFDGGGAQTVGLRFTGVDIPAGAQVVSAFLRFQADEAHSGPTDLAIAAEAADDARALEQRTNDISSRIPTAAAVQWLPAAWPTVGESGPAQTTPDLSAVVQEVVSRPGWASGNALVFVVTGSGERVAEAYEGDAAGAALLHVEYSGGAP